MTTFKAAHLGNSKLRPSRREVRVRANPKTEINLQIGCWRAGSRKSLASAALAQYKATILTQVA
jgi:hypothetical protein